MKLTKTQQNAVNELVNSFNLLEKNEVYFKAPTGSGKTFMIANVINELSKIYSDEKLFFIIATLSSAKLPNQMESNLHEYFQFIGGQHLEIEKVESPSVNEKVRNDKDLTLIARKNKIMILGTSSFGKGRLFTERGTLDSLLNQITNENFKLVYIRDEAHYGSESSTIKSIYKDYSIDKIKNLDINDENIKRIESRFEAKMQKIAHFTIKMTATPNNVKVKQIEITENDLLSDNVKLLKTNLIKNEGIKQANNEPIDDFRLLQVACKKFKEIKKIYDNPEKEPGLININPAMIIQVRDETSNDFCFEDDIKKVIEIIEENNLTWAKYFSNEKISFNSSNIKQKVNLKEISKNTSLVDCVIIKVGPAVGWNIPRACMLVQLRCVSSENLNIQTIGRIKRNPNPTFINNSVESISNNYWIYSSWAENSRKEWSYYVLQDNFKKSNSVKMNQTSFYQGKINRNLWQLAISDKEYSEKIMELLDAKEIINNLKELQVKWTISGKNDREKFIVSKEETINDNLNNYIPRIIEKITNCIELELYVKKFQYSNDSFFNQNIIDQINNWINELRNNDEYANYINLLSTNQVWFVISKIYINKIKEIHKESISKIRENKKEKEFILYGFSTKHLPDNEYQWNTNNFILIDEDKLRYAYINTSQLNQEKNKHYLDSKNEEIVLNLLASYFWSLYEKDHEKYKQIVKIWTKNPTLHGVNYEYYNDENEIKSSFPDILIKYKNHQIILEIKGDNDSDYNPEKTQKIINAYKSYINDEIQSTNNANITETLTLLVCSVKKNANCIKEISFAGASTNEEINSKLEKRYFNMYGNINFEKFFDAFK